MAAQSVMIVLTNPVRSIVTIKPTKTMPFATIIKATSVPAVVLLLALEGKNINKSRILMFEKR